MSVFDLIILVVAAGFALRGAMKGMVSQIVSVGSLFVCWFVASRFAFIFAPSIPAEAPWNKIGAMVVLFAVTMLVIWFLRERLEKKLKDWKLEKLNSFFGFLLGFIKGLVLCMILTFFCVTLCETTRSMVFQSKSGNFLIISITKIRAFVPKDSCELLQTQLDLFNAKVNGDTEQAKTAFSPEEDSLQQMLNDKKLSVADGQQGFGSVLTRSNELLQEAKRLQDDFQEQKNKAVSLLDAVGKFFWGSKTAENQEKTATAPVTKSSDSAVLFPQKEAQSSPPKPTEFTARNSDFLNTEPLVSEPKLSMPLPLIIKPAPAYQEEAFFSRPASAEQSTGQSDMPSPVNELSALLPLSSLPKSGGNGIPEQAELLPWSATSFRLSDTSAERPLHQILSSSRAADAPPATLFSPRQ